VSRRLEDAAANIGFQHKNSKSRLQPQTPGDGLNSNRAAVCREGECQPKHSQNTENASEAAHSVLVSIFSDHAMNEKSFSRRCVANLITCFDQRFSAGGARFGIIVNSAQRFSRYHTVSNFLV